MSRSVALLALALLAPSPAWAEPHWQGSMVQGFDWQATALQGVDLQETMLQGFDWQGTSLVATLEDGTRIEGEGWLGATLPLETDTGEVVLVEVVSVEERDGLTWYGLALDGQNLCGFEDGDGLFVEGIWDETGMRVEAGTARSYSCASGVLAKCVVWGYEPWDVGPDAHQACTRLARADYCGDGYAWTENGTLVDVYDDLGVLPYEGLGRELGMSFEAGWGPDGAVCMEKTRYHDVQDRELPHCFDDLPRCATWEQAVEQGAWLGNSSKVQVR